MFEVWKMRHTNTRINRDPLRIVFLTPWWFIIVLERIIIIQVHWLLPRLVNHDKCRHSAVSARSHSYTFLFFFRTLENIWLQCNLYIRTHTIIHSALCKDRIIIITSYNKIANSVLKLYDGVRYTLYYNV